MPPLLDDLFIRPDVAGARILVTFTAPAGCRRFRWTVRDGARRHGQGGQAAVPGRLAAFEASMGAFRPWNLDTPHLYTLRLEWESGGRRHAHHTRFGMRALGIANGTITLNGAPVWLRGYIRGREAHDHPNLQGLPPAAYYAKNIRAAKTYGFNLVRFHSRVPPEECLDMADQLGLFVHVEQRPYFGKYQREREGLNDRGELVADADWAATIRRLRNHPCVLVYCIGNEIRHPGANPRVAVLGETAHALDPTRFFLDTCAHGEFDRGHVDLDVQHMSYFFPFGKDARMFEDTQNWLVFGSCTGLPVEARDPRRPPAWRVTRAMPVRRPVLAHEICHYTALHDLRTLAAKFRRFAPDRAPWWIGSLQALIARKGLQTEYPRMLEASRRFQFLSWKLAIEAARRSPLLAGFHFLQLSDTDRYENGNGLLDCFDDPKGVDLAAFRSFNGDTVLLADLSRRTFFEGDSADVPVVLSHVAPAGPGRADFRFALRCRSSGAALLEGGLDAIPLAGRGRREIARLRLALPRAARPEALVLEMRLAAGRATVAENRWNLWLYPNRPETLPPFAATVCLDSLDLAARYPQLRIQGTLARPERLMIVNRFTDAVLRHLERGGRVLMLYRAPETRDRAAPAPRERYALRATWDRFKAVIWDRGTQHGAFLRPSRALAGFPHDGFLDLQFHALVDDCDKIVLDDFPARVAPLIQGVDKAVRDRYDVKVYGLPEFQPDRTLRRFAYLFELAVGPGRLLVSGFNFTGLNRGVPEACALFESLARYVISPAFRPKAALAPNALRHYLRRTARAPLVKERLMTQYWQLDDAPLESDAYWQEARAYLGEPVVS